jgi:hypothetical protein
MSTATIMMKPAGNRMEDYENPDINPESGGTVSVVFTSAELTLKALVKAREHTKPLGAGVAIIAVQVVPLIVPIDRIPSPMEFIIRRFEKIICAFPENIRVFVYICRDRMDVYKHTLKPHFPVFIGIRKRWWPTRDEMLARKLRRVGYNIIVVESE